MILQVGLACYSWKGRAAEVPRDSRTVLDDHVGVDQNYGPFWGLYYSIFLIVYRGPKGAHNFDQPPCLSSFKANTDEWPPNSKATRAWNKNPTAWTVQVFFFIKGCFLAVSWDRVLLRRIPGLKPRWPHVRPLLQPYTWPGLYYPYKVSKNHFGDPYK